MKKLVLLLACLLSFNAFASQDLPSTNATTAPATATSPGGLISVEVFGPTVVNPPYTGLPYSDADYAALKKEFKKPGPDGHLLVPNYNRLVNLNYAPIGGTPHQYTIFKVDGGTYQVKRVFPNPFNPNGPASEQFGTLTELTFVAYLYQNIFAGFRP